MTSNRVRVLLIIAPALLASVPARSASFGRFNVTAVMGQPLQLTVPLRAEAGERISTDCLSAEIFSGEQRLPANEIRIDVRPGAAANEWLARVTTTSPIVEPVLEINVSAGCERRFTRHITALADPPLIASALPPAPGTLASAEPPSVPADPPRVVAAPRADGGPRRASRRQDREPASAPARPPVRALALKSAKAPKSSDAPGASRLQLDVGNGPSLKMDFEEPVWIATAATPATAGSAAPASADPPARSASSTEEQRLAALEARLNQLSRDRQANQARTAELQARLEQSEGRAAAAPWLAGALGLLLLALGALVWRNRSQRSAEGGAWWAPGRSAAVDIDVGDEADANADWARPLDASGSAAAVSPPTWLDPSDGSARQASAGLAGSSAAPDLRAGRGGTTPAERFNAASTLPFDALSEPAREVSVEELLDLEQQADFFIALGQEDAAVDLLMAYLRSTGGQTPLPYTKLLEIYRRQGDRSAYERIRARFNRRFNAYAPDWDTGPQVGRWLEEYPDAVDQLQAAWPSPLDAMAVLEAMLFRRDETQDLFDLPAYKDVLLMYAIARDNWQSGHAGDAHEVDLLLPLGESGRPGSGMDRTQPIDVDHVFPTRFELDPVDGSDTISSPPLLPPATPDAR